MGKTGDDNDDDDDDNGDFNDDGDYDGDYGDDGDDDDKKPPGIFLIKIFFLLPGSCYSSYTGRHHWKYPRHPIGIFVNFFTPLWFSGTLTPDTSLLIFQPSQSTKGLTLVWFPRFSRNTIFLHTAALHLQLGLDFFSYLFLFLREIDLWR